MNPLMSKTISCWATIGKRSVSRHLPHKTTPSEPSRFYIFQTSTNTRTIPTMTRINCVLECVAIRSDHTSAWIRTRSQSHAKLDSNFTTKTATVKVSDVFLSHQHARFFCHYCRPQRVRITVKRRLLPYVNKYVNTATEQQVSISKM